MKKEDKISLKNKLCVIENKNRLERTKRKNSQTFFDNRARFIRPKELADYLGVSIRTVYDWYYNREDKGIPENLFLKLGRLLFIRTDVLEIWLGLSPSQNKKVEGL